MMKKVFLSIFQAGILCVIVSTIATSLQVHADSSVTLYSGWNFITIPYSELLPESEEAMKDILAAYSYDMQSGSFLPTKKLKPGKVYWVLTENQIDIITEQQGITKYIGSDASIYGTDGNDSIYCKKKGDYDHGYFDIDEISLGDGNDKLIITGTIEDLYFCSMGDGDDTVQIGPPHEDEAWCDFHYLFFEGGNDTLIINAGCDITVDDIDFENLENLQMGSGAKLVFKNNKSRRDAMVKLSRFSKYSSQIKYDPYY